ncbi:hypothetical protein Y032_0175g516 [Ancylostoma ceylanicum]|uniref:C2 domain-containing protein n=1 Tax=Ancylostoma ceylanicum TaxID=53326 RepID=A0A016SUR8_9BILA|nr:hypothetical protein Y032_0175g516 [Ancylostoma ceylanicum]
MEMDYNEFNTYVTVKLQNVKSTTAVVRGNIPCWEQEFIFETNRLDEGMIIELWSKGVLWDRLLGVHFMPLTDVRYCAAPGDGKWLQMDQELETRNGQTVGTSKPTGHNVLVDSRFELPFDAQSEDAEELQAKLQALNRLIDSDQVVPNSHQRVPFTHSGISEDSDYTSDVSFPIHHQPNSSAHQWDSHLHPHRYRHHPKDTTLQASYEDEEDAYHARPDHYHEPAHHRYDSDYAVKTYDSEVPSHDYEYSTYDTEASTGRGVPSGNHKMSYRGQQQYDNAYRYESNGYKDEEYYHEEEADHHDDAHFGRNPHYSERYESMEGTSDYRDEYRQQYPGDYWNEQEPLSYNSRPPQSMQPLRSWHDSMEGAESTTEKENCLDEQNTYEDTEGRNSKLSYRTASVDKTERRYDSDSSHRGGGYYGDDYDDRRTDSRAHNWRYDSIQEEDHVKEDWHDEKALRSWRDEPVKDEDWHSEDQRTHDEEEHYAAEGYQADREDSSRQNSVERADGVAHPTTDIAHQTIQEEDEKRTPHELWHWAYKQVCKSLGYKVSYLKKSTYQVAVTSL